MIFAVFAVWLEEVTSEVGPMLPSLKFSEEMEPEVSVLVGGWPLYLVKLLQPDATCNLCRYYSEN